MLITVFIINSIIIAITVILHYEALNYLNKGINTLNHKPRKVILVSVFGAFFVHVAEVWIFAFAYFFMLKSDIFGSLEDNFTSSILDALTSRSRHIPQRV